MRRPRGVLPQVLSHLAPYAASELVAGGPSGAEAGPALPRASGRAREANGVTRLVRSREEGSLPES